MENSILLIIIGALICVEGLFIALNPIGVKKIMNSLGKNLKQLRWYGVVELIIGIIILGLAIL